MKKQIFVFVFVILMINLFSAQDSSDREYVYQNLTQNGFELQWRTTSSANLEVILSAQTTGWIAVGFGATSAMANANIIIGYVSNGTLNIRDDFGVSQSSHSSDLSLGGTSNILVSSGTEENGATTIQFQIPLNSGDQFDKVLTPGQNISLILARGGNSADNFTSVHNAVGSGQIMIEEIPVAVEYVQTQAQWNDAWEAVIEWQTGNENNMSQYHIYRASMPDFSQSVLLNPDGITAMNTENATYSFSDSVTPTNQNYYYWIEGIENDNSVHLSDVIELQALSNDNPDIDTKELKVQNYPNPFNPFTRIAYEIPVDGQVEINIFNTKGQLVNTLYKGYKVKGSYHDLVWNGEDHLGNSVSSGIYILILKSSYSHAGKKLILLK